jgi:hypothetical protein
MTGPRPPPMTRVFIRPDWGGCWPGALTPEPMRPGWTDARRLKRSVPAVSLPDRYRRVTMHQPAHGEMAHIRWQTSARNRTRLAIDTEPPRSAAWRWLTSDGTGQQGWDTGQVAGPGREVRGVRCASACLVARIARRPGLWRSAFTEAGPPPRVPGPECLIALAWT